MPPLHNEYHDDKIVHEIKKCIECNRGHECDTARCQYCRNLYFLHYKYHDDNIVHKKTLNELTFGKYKGRTVDSLVGKDDNYIQWLIGGNICYGVGDNELWNHIRLNLLPKTAIQFGKYKENTFEWIKSNDMSYYRWIKNKCDKPFCGLL